MPQIRSDPARDRPTILLIANNHFLRRDWRAWVNQAFPQCRSLEADTLEMLRWVLSRTSPKVVVVDTADLGSRVAAALRVVSSMAPQAELVTVSLSGDQATEGAAGANEMFVSLNAIIQEILAVTSAGPVSGAHPGG